MATSIHDPAPHGMTVLVADDDDVTRGLLRQLLRICHMNVIGEARNGKQALESFRRLRPQIVCLDVQMPEMNGLEVLAAIRSESANTPDAPEPIVIMITGSATSEVVKGAIAARTDGIIAKPFSAAKIAEEINRCAARLARKKAAAAAS